MAMDGEPQETGFKHFDAYTGPKITLPSKFNSLTEGALQSHERKSNLKLDSSRTRLSSALSEGRSGLEKRQKMQRNPKMRQTQVVSKNAL